ncbi:toll/interleukin-1 receptor domain-containing protein [Methylobacterium sp. R2-1]|uniref:toll/interleukin-1 receptor domain-containing protein n=1 Tax=Methylobacterium sp. R2-1 TaxID=2587064 RepID=UPI00161802AE|nr:toll/interleukin-1 receptor domain-containing protein [Methylobacterium sp. R2-1]MBB2961869.1 myosin heavy subunit [Methylobacterium sp. R2-1]
MSLAADRSNLARLNKEISELRTKEAKEAKNAADAQKKIASANASARKASSPSSAKSYYSTAEREERNLTIVQANQAKHATQAASKTQDAARLQAKIAKDEETERKKTAAADDRRRLDDETRRKTENQQQQRREAAAARVNSNLQQRIRDLETQVAEQLEVQASSTPAFKPTAPPGEEEAYDVFISHAWEDKEDFVKDLATKARDAGIKVWYDKFSLQWGDSIRQKIDAGLASSYFGIAVLSPSFFSKP